MISRSIVIKLWVVMVLLVLVVLGSSVLIQTFLLERTYYRQHTEQLITAAQGLSESVTDFHDSTVMQSMMWNTASALGAYVIVLNSEGDILYTQGPDRYGRQGHGHGHGRGHMMGNNTHIAGDNTQYGIEINIDQVLQGETVAARGQSQLANTEVLTVGVPIYDKELITGAILLQAPIPAISSRVRAFQNVSLYTAVLGVLLATVLSLVLSRSLVKPLLEINKATKDMVEGNYNSRVEVTSSDEIGMLAQSFNELSARLAEKVKTLEQIDNNRRDFVASISHELRTPLTIIQGYTEALRDGMAKDESQRQQYLTYVHEELMRMRRLVDELLDMRRLETGQLKTNFSTVNIAQLTVHLIERFKPLFEEKNVSLQYDIPENLPDVKADKDRLAQVLTNLLDNALRVSGEGGQVSVTVQDLQAEISITVSDTGPGIAKEDIPLIWERFYKADKSRTRGGAGTGLGLAISKRIIELHKGNIWVDSELGKGSQFTFTVPK
ncbi:sensor histidine kinase [Desulfofalx alkaliphila]|uniref:sensor histidine kinase n=1 Tax=Desulfofalx alkaliphila TaxID=105483 RepID=UPI0004E1B09B|nr:ATP-binding protein [Desulfofalx alkaliphila]